MTVANPRPHFFLEAAIKKCLNVTKITRDVGLLMQKVWDVEQNGIQQIRTQTRKLAAREDLCNQNSLNHG